MISRITLSSNPKMIVFIGMLLAFLAAGALLIIFVNPLIGIIVVALALYISYNMYKVLRDQFKSRITTDESTIHFLLPGNEEYTFKWEDVTHSGLFVHSGKKKRQLFLYREPEDKLIAIPDEFTDFEALIDILRQKTPFRTLEQQGKEDLNEALKKIVE
jgi:hypothetical protein